MTRHDITLNPADVDTIAEGGLISLPGPGATFEITSRDTWTASADPDVHRFALSADDLDRLRGGRTITVLPAKLPHPVYLTVDASEVAR